MTKAPAAGDREPPRQPAATTARRKGRWRWQLWLELAAVALALYMGVRWHHKYTGDFIFAGADSYAYTSAAYELRTHHRYAFRLPPWFPKRSDEVTPGRCRPPGYPLLLAAIGAPDEQNYNPYFERVKHVQWLLNVFAALLCYLLGRTVAGRPAAAVALLGYLLHPTAMAFSASILTETLAITLTTLALWLCALACEPRRAPLPATWALCGAAIAVGLGMLTRVDGLLLGPCLLLPLWLRREPLPARARMVVLALLCALLTYSPWIVRNLKTFGAPYPFGSLCEIDGTPIERTWFHHWYATWVRNESDLLTTQPCIYRRTCHKDPPLFPEHAFDSEAEAMRVGELLNHQSNEGMTESVDNGFHALWQDRVRRHPLRTLGLVPLQRAFELWLAPNNLPTRAQLPIETLPLMEKPEYYSRLARETAWLALSGVLALLLPAWRARRRLLWLALPAIALRTAFLATFGFPEPRYILELLPLTLVLGGIAVVTPMRILRYLSRERAVTVS